MKKNLFIVAAVALVAMVSCNKEEVNNAGVDTTPEPAVVVEFEAGFNADTKTALDATGKKTLWEADDLISINGQQFKIKELLNDGANAVFVNVGNLPDDFAAPFIAVYPYGSNGIPATQTAKANTFDPAAAIETATSDNNTLVFENRSSLLKFQVPAACSSVSLTADENLAQDSKTVTISGNFAAGTDYYVAVLPGTKTNFNVKVNDRASKSASSVTINEKSIVNMGELPMKVRIYVTVWPHYDNWDNWKQTPKIHYWGDYGETTWPGVNMILENGSKYYYEFEYSATKKTQFLVNNGTGAEKSADSEKITMNKDYSYEVWTDWVSQDGNNYHHLVLHKN